MNQDFSPLPQLSSFSTHRAPRGEEIDYWREARGEAYVPVRTDPLGSVFAGEIELGRYRSFRLSTKRAGAERVGRSRSDIAQSRDAEDYLYFLFQLRGSLLVEQAGREALADPGSLVIYDSATPFRLRSEAHYEQAVLELPADQAFELAGVKRTDDLLAQRFPCDGALGSVAAFFGHLAQTQTGDPMGAQRLEPHAEMLGASLISLLAPSPVSDPGPLPRDEALAFMRTHLTDPDLDADAIAAGLHMSRRSLFRLFEGTGEPAMARLRSLRLDRARAILQMQPDKPIAAVAHEAGFSSPVQFYRAFGLTVGMTPGEYRDSLGGTDDADAVRRQDT